jgi:hypothetical protein
MDTVKKKYLLFIPLFLFSFGLRSQFSGWSASAGYGKMLNIHPFTPSYGNSYFLKAEYIFNPAERKDWHSLYRIKELGWGLTFIDHGNPDILGHSLSLTPKIAFENKIKGKIPFTTELSLGLAYFNNPYNNISNPNNYIVGSHISADVGVSLAVSIRSLDLGFAFRHFSNGHVAVPNVGSNIPFVFLKYSQRNNKKTPSSFEANPLPQPVEKVLISTSFQLGVHEMEGTARPVDGPKFTVFGAQVLAERILTHRSKIRLGSSFSYYQSFRNYLFNQQLLDEFSWWNSSKITAVVGHEFIFGKTAFYTDLMYNVYYPFKRAPLELGRIEELKWMHKNLSFEAGFNFYFKEVKYSEKANPFVGIGIRTIGGKADYVFTRIGISF